MVHLCFRLLAVWFWLLAVWFWLLAVGFRLLAVRFLPLRAVARRFGGEAAADDVVARWHRATAPGLAGTVGHRSAGGKTARLAAPAQPFPSGVMSKEISRGRLSEAADAWRGHFDAGRGGFGDPPKRPGPERLRFLLRTSPAERDAAPADVLLSLDQ